MFPYIFNFIIKKTKRYLKTYLPWVIVILFIIIPFKFFLLGLKFLLKYIIGFYNVLFESVLKVIFIFFFFNLLPFLTVSLYVMLCIFIFLIIISISIIFLTFTSFFDLVFYLLEYFICFIRFIDINKFYQSPIKEIMLFIGYDFEGVNFRELVNKENIENFLKEIYQNLNLILVYFVSLVILSIKLIILFFYEFVLILNPVMLLIFKKGIIPLIPAVKGCLWYINGIAKILFIIVCQAVDYLFWTLFEPFYYRLSEEEDNFDDPEPWELNREFDRSDYTYMSKPSHVGYYNSMNREFQHPMTLNFIYKYYYLREFDSQNRRQYSLIKIYLRDINKFSWYEVYKYASGMHQQYAMNVHFKVARFFFAIAFLQIYLFITTFEVYMEGQDMRINMTGIEDAALITEDIWVSFFKYKSIRLFVFCCIIFFLFYCGFLF